MENNVETITQESQIILDEWLTSCTRNRVISRNTVVVGITVLDYLRKSPIVSKKDVLSKGGEIKGVRSGLKYILSKYNIPEHYLKEATTRQGPQDGQRLFVAFEWGNKFTGLSDDEREGIILGLISRLTALAYKWLERQNLRLAINRRQAPTTWIQTIIENARSRSSGVVEQHLVGAKLERRFDNIDIPNRPAHAADLQTSRDGDFSISNIVYHVTATPGRRVMEKCADNIRSGLYPILLVPSDQEGKARHIAEGEEIEKELTIISIEGFIALNIIEMATVENKDFFAVLKEIVEIYNKRLAEVETDLSLHIEVH